MKIHISSVHEKNQLFRCDVCEYSCYEKGSMYDQACSIHSQEKKI